MSTAVMLELFYETGGAVGPYRHFIKTNNRTQIRELHASLTNRHFIKTNNCSYARTSCFINYMTRQRHQ